MKIRIGTLRRILREVAISPSVFKQQPIQDILDRPNIAKVLPALEQPFRNAVMTNLMLKAQGSYNAETRELDDAAYEKMKQVADQVTEVMMAQVQKAIQSAWAQAMKGGGAEEKPAAKPAAKAVA